jgi:acetyl esterase/lipase
MSMRAMLVRLLLISLAVLIGAAAPRAQEGPSYKRQEDVIYGRKYGSALTLDVFTPKAKANGAAVVQVVSGGWFSAHEAIPLPIAEFFTRRGYTVFAVVHGSQPKYTIDEILPDLHRAVRFIRSRAGEYGIDPERIGITGGSAGGHLSLMMGTTGKEPVPMTKDPLERFSSRVQAVGCFFPPTDFLNWGEPGKLVLGKMPERIKPAFAFRQREPKTDGFVPITDESKIRAIMREVSPITHITASSAPALIIHGDKDGLVPIQQAEVMVAKLKQAGVSTELVVKAGADHGWKGMDKDLVTIADWFDRHLLKSSSR